ncbi:hypothetical protein TNIN_445841 [Trichonephila inaurata madagascariensis]|uniref:Uncharacterized protein n=1 Tax=Trichonephila inaurata madagascariensis TaxID=2747483 RepID=A0A8X7C334_9ARAC|nr:hypothetical protein TNIN_445841 [Trichonephila inaurata madagascariensis]
MNRARNTYRVTSPQTHQHYLSHFIQGLESGSPCSSSPMHQIDSLGLPITIHTFDKGPFISSPVPGNRGTLRRKSMKNSERGKPRGSRGLAYSVPEGLDEGALFPLGTACPCNHYRSVVRNGKKPRTKAVMGLVVRKGLLADQNAQDCLS